MIDHALHALLSPLFPANCFTPHAGDEELQSKTFPYATYHYTNSSEEESWCMGGGYTRYDYEINVYARDVQINRNLRDQIRAVIPMLPQYVPASFVTEDAPWEPESKSYHTIINFQLRVRN